MPRKVFVAGEILTAADVNTNLMDQAVMVFDDATARTTAIPTPVEGMVTYLKDTDAVEKFDGSAFVNVNTDSGKILQVVQDSTTTQTTVASTTFTDTTLVGTITPLATTSKILVLISQNIETQFQTSIAVRSAGVRLLRGATVVLTLPNFKTVMSSFTSGSPNTHGDNNSIVFLDSPNTTSAVTYKTQTQISNTAASSVAIAQTGSSPSTIILMEVAG